MIDLIKQYWQPFLWGSPNHISGLAMTLWLTVISCAIGFVLALPAAVGRVTGPSWVRWLIRIYTFVFRGTPLYVQLLIIYSGIYSLDMVRNTPGISSFFRDALNCTILAFTLNTCAYTTELLAGAVRATPRGEVEAARSLGLAGVSLYRRIILPSALRRALPAYSNEVILMLHATSLASAATVSDILKVARDANADYYLPFVAFGIAAVLYAAICFMLIWLFRKAEQKWLMHLSPSQ
ncbi:MAG: histidine ABC transporter permease HisM [Verrucomicrobia bacterium]|nr:histidine ABC transporter permease HisM [Verrucomicrobiota bacterium]